MSSGFSTLGDEAVVDSGEAGAPQSSSNVCQINEAMDSNGVILLKDLCWH